MCVCASLCRWQRLWGWGGGELGVIGTLVCCMLSSVRLPLSVPFSATFTASSVVVCFERSPDLKDIHLPSHSGLGPLDPTKESVYAAVREIFEEAAELFPSKLFHVGGDEVDFGCWDSNADIRRYGVRSHQWSARVGEALQKRSAGESNPSALSRVSVPSFCFPDILRTQKSPRVRCRRRLQQALSNSHGSVDHISLTVLLPQTSPSLSQGSWRTTTSRALLRSRPTT